MLLLLVRHALLVTKDSGLVQDASALLNFNVSSRTSYIWGYTLTNRLKHSSVSICVFLPKHVFEHMLHSGYSFDM